MTLTSMLKVLGAFIFISLAMAKPHGHNMLARADDPIPQFKRYPTKTITISPIPANLDAPTSSADACTPNLNFLGLTAGNNASKYRAFCNVDFPNHDIWPFILAGGPSECMQHCNSYNDAQHDEECVGFIYAPDRRYKGKDDCYLKSSMGLPQTATISLVGAMLNTDTPTWSTTSQITSSPLEYSPLAQFSQETKAANIGAKFSSPVVKTVKELGSSTNNPTIQYVSHPPYPERKVANNLLVPGINADLVTDYPLAKDTGIWTSKSSPIKNDLADMKGIPHLSRDGGKGANINGTNIFVFCDTGIYMNGEWVGFVSSSVATDDDMNGLRGESLTIVDHIGQWQDDVGRMRGFAPMTEGEEGFNQKISGQGYRYAVWPETSPIGLNSTHGLVYAAVVYDDVDMSTQNATFQQYTLTTLGNTLLVVGVDGRYGPYAVRQSKLFFTEHDQDHILPGSLGGFRAWGSTGHGSTDGTIYILSKVPNYKKPGVFVAKVDASQYDDDSAYVYWDGQAWSGSLPSADNLDAAVMDDTIQDLDIVYSPTHNTLIMVYLKPGVNKFFYRYANPPSNIIPAWTTGGAYDWADEAIRGEWIEEQVLHEVEPPELGAIYAGGVHAGYFGKDDISEGGSKMLVTWTERTGQDGDASDSGYLLKSAIVEFDCSGGHNCGAAGAED